MRIALAAVIGSLVLSACGGTAARTDSKYEVERELEKFQGTWKIVSVEAGGEVLPIEPFKDMTVTFAGDRYDVRVGDQLVDAATVIIDPSTSPKVMDARTAEGPNQGAMILGIYEINGDTFTECFDPEGKQRPTEFKTAPGSQVTRAVHARVQQSPRERRHIKTRLSVPGRIGTARLRNATDRDATSCINATS